MKMRSLLVFLIFSHSFLTWASPCLEAYKRVALANPQHVRNDELIALQMLYPEAELVMNQSESYFFMKNAVYDLGRKKNIQTNFQELQAHIYAGFDRGEFCDKNTMPKKSAGQIIRIAKAQIKSSRSETLDIQKTMPKIYSPNELAKSLGNAGAVDRKPAGGNFQK